MRIELIGKRLKRSIVFVGMMGCGKTTIGRLAAGRLGLPFADTDIEIESGERNSIVELFAEKGEAYFRAIEAEILSCLLSGPPRAISIGGGAFLSDANREVIRRRAVSVWLDADVDLLWERVKNKTERPLLRTEDPYRTLAELLEQRIPIYSSADVRVQAEHGLSKEGMVEKVVVEVSNYLTAKGLVDEDGK